MLLDAARSQLLIVDMQERLMPAMHQAETVIDRCALLLQTAAELKVPALVSEQYRKGLGATVPRLGNALGDVPVMEKMHFSCAADPAMAAHIKGLAAQGRNQLVVAGVEAHVCVLQSVLGFKDMGLDVYLVADAVTSRQPQSVALAESRVRHAGGSVVNTEMVSFEWLHIAGTPEFKVVSKLMK
ncbi:MAG: isochorismatase family protein [Rhodospirillaceae bacterium]|nr:MAG: isochorismatase family protein [Rhodospirillaceae bacterium]